MNTTIQSVKVTNIRQITLSNRHLRALIHQSWIAGNLSYELDNSEAGLAERSKFIDEMMLREGFAKPKTEEPTPCPTAS